MIVMNDFTKETTSIQRELNAAIQRVIASGWYILGKETQAFEQEFSRYIGSQYCIGVANGLEALQIALMALEIGPDDEVITVSNSAVATSIAITAVGATPVFVDIDEYYHLDPTHLEKAITSKTKAILPVHLFGQVVNFAEIKTIADQHGLPIIEDACQAHGAMYKQQKAGSLGTLGCFSFYPTKNLGALGDGGAITTNDADLYEKCLMLRNYGQKTRYIHEIQGLNSRLDELQAAILRVKLIHLDQQVSMRNERAQWYFEQLSELDFLAVPQIRDNAYHSFHLFVLATPYRDQLMKYLNQHSIEALIHYPIPIHKQRCYPTFNSVVLKETELAASQILSLPIHPFLSKPEVDQICSVIRSFKPTQHV